ncbi:MAG: sigma-70 family RNA polymerase sigma factor [Spirochaetota bacterium]|nr:MAG: sigma-70 family RNA polymerase sigma factor [Spirochaetota bacterium]
MGKENKKDFLMSPDTEFKNFFKEHQNTLFRIIFGYVRQTEASEDLVVEAFIKIYERWSRVRRMDNPTGYLVRSGINLAKTYLKKDSRFQALEIPENVASNPMDSPDKIFFLKKQNQDLEAELLKLNERERNIILLKDMSGYKFVDIANHLGMKLSTVKSIYRRAKIKLAKSLYSGSFTHRTLEEIDEPR